MKNTLILHGWGGTSKENWLPWLRKEIEFKVDEVFAPSLPSTKSPVLEEQLEYLYVYSNDFKDGGNIVGHSLGGQLALAFVNLNNITHSNIVLVAPTYAGLAEELGTDALTEYFPILEKYYNTQINFEKFNKLNNKVTIFLSEDDPYINMKSAKEFYGEIKNVEFIEFKNKGHFNQGGGITELEEILDYIN